jgi:PleD family two-component response regulator
VAAGFEALYGCADQALYRAKSEGKSRYVFFDSRDDKGGVVGA